MSDAPTLTNLLIVAIDGPAGAGKSTVAAALAHKFGLLNLETGAMYRALALKALSRNIDCDDPAAVSALASETRIELDPAASGNRVFLDGNEVTGQLRQSEVTAAASRVSIHPAVRAWMVAEQRAMGLRAPGGVVMEGRDIGTVVFPDATVKLFLDASVEARGKRRYQQQGETAHAGPRETVTRETLSPEALNRETSTREAITRDIAERDRRDRNRETSPLRPADDAILIDTTTMPLEAVMAMATQLVQERLPQSFPKTFQDRRVPNLPRPA